MSMVEVIVLIVFGLLVEIEVDVYVGLVVVDWNLGVGLKDLLLVGG